MSPVVCGVPLAVACLVAPVAGQPPRPRSEPMLAAGQARGNLIVNGVAVPLTHAVALSAPYSIDPTRRSITVILSSTPLTPAALESRTVDALLDTVTDGLIVEFGPEDVGPGSEYVFKVRHRAVKDYPELVRRGTFTQSESTVDARAGDRMAGTLRSNFGGKPDELGGHKLQFTIGYDAPVKVSFKTR